MDPQAIRDLQRRLEVLERTTVRYRQGVVDDPDPLDVALSDVVIEAVPALASALPIPDGANVGLLAFGNALLALGSIDAPPAWQSYTPTITTVTLGTGGTNTGRWVKIGRTVHAAGRVALGTSGSLTGTDIPISLPVATAGYHTGVAFAYDTSPGAMYLGGCFCYPASDEVYVRLGNGSGSVVSLGAGTPFTWASGDSLQWQLTYEAAS